MRSVILFAALLGGCVDADSDSCTTDNPEYPDCLPESDGGKTDTATAHLAQMNDVTIVMPLAKTQKQFNGYMPAAQLLPKALFTSRFPDQAGPTPVGSDVSMKYDNLRVVAVRLDPCFVQIGPVTDPSKCDNQLRVVFQSLTFQGNSTDAVDGAVHAFYRLTRAQLTSALKEIVALRKANGQTTAMGALKPHPLIVKQGIDGAFSKGLQQILLKYAGPANLIRFTHFKSGNLQTTWTFSGFDVGGTKAAPTTTAMVIPAMPANTTSVKFFEGFGHPMQGTFAPESIAKDAITSLVNAAKAQAANSAARKALYDAALRIENPQFHSPNTIDCASCHVGQAARLLIGDDVLGLSAAGNPNLFARDPSFVSASSMKQTTSVRDQSLNLHMLSYRNDQLMIGQRVINETAAVVAYINGKVLH
jgi:hypothetical protein